jgi:hypothetical protein
MVVTSIIFLRNEMETNLFIRISLKNNIILAKCGSASLQSQLFKRWTQEDWNLRPAQAKRSVRVCFKNQNELGASGSHL